MDVGARMLAVAVVTVAMACGKAGPVEPPQIANPASVYCEEQGGTVELVETPDGQDGICVLPDGTRCDEWAFFHGECPCDGGCPMWFPPGPRFCADGTVVPGPTDACGCQGPPVCRRMAMAPSAAG